jgi:hypothetical protein
MEWRSDVNFLSLDRLEDGLAFSLDSLHIWSRRFFVVAQTLGRSLFSIGTPTSFPAPLFMFLLMLLLMFVLRFVYSIKDSAILLLFLRSWGRERSWRLKIDLLQHLIGILFVVLIEFSHNFTYTNFMSPLVTKPKTGQAFRIW